MNSYGAHHAARTSHGSTAKNAQTFTGNSQPDLFERGDTPLPGSMNDAALIRSIVADAIRKSSKSRAQIAEEMTYLVGREITERMLNGFTADSRDDYRWPAELDRAFCEATGDDRLLRCRVELAGYRVISQQEAEILELGRQYLMRQRAADNLAALEKRLGGVAL